ncbi:MAG: putative lipid II flippase FtsW [Chloroflexi bacterium]|nr:putative lipid II flippase FtsW [Chloroflexota bacterium]
MSPRRRPPDLVLLIAVLVLLVLGIVMVYSASFIIGHNEFNDGNYFLLRHLTALMVGLVALGLVAGIDYRRWQRWAGVGLVVCLVLLVLVLIPGIGSEVYGARRWITLGRFQVQPSELTKLVLLVFLATWLARRPGRVSRLSSSLQFVGLIGLVALLIMREPDMGTTIVIVLAATSVFWVAGANLAHVATVGAVGVVAMGILATSAAYRVQRLQGWSDPWADPQGIGWHTVQSLIALGSGGLLGRGLGAGLQKAYYLPNAHTDAIFSVVGEELGLVGTVGVLVLFAIVAWRGLVIARQASDLFGRLLAVGMVGLLVWQGLLNMMVSVNAVPFTGVTLPFLSFGGTSLVVSLIAVGFLLSVSRGTTAPEREASPRRAVSVEAAWQRPPAPRATGVASRTLVASSPRAAARRRIR